VSFALKKLLLLELKIIIIRIIIILTFYNLIPENSFKLGIIVLVMLSKMLILF